MKQEILRIVQGKAPNPGRSMDAPKETITDTCKTAEQRDTQHTEVPTMTCEQLTGVTKKHREETFLNVMNELSFFTPTFFNGDEVTSVPIALLMLMRKVPERHTKETMRQRKTLHTNKFEWAMERENC